MFDPIPYSDHVSLAHEPGDYKADDYFDRLTEAAEEGRS